MTRYKKMRVGLAHDVTSLGNKIVALLTQRQPQSHIHRLAMLKKKCENIEARFSSITENEPSMGETSVPYRQGMARTVLLLVVYDLESCDIVSIQSVFKNGCRECYRHCAFSH